MEKRILECVPNISEGRDQAKIQAIASVVEKVPGVKLLDIDPGYATNRTVITFAGEPEAVVEAAFQLIKKAAELIDMRTHKGEHPRFGATDVCPFIPISGISMEEAAELAQKLAKRVGNELQIPVYLYEFSAREEKRKNLANCRAGEYEGLQKKLEDPQWKPDEGPSDFKVALTTGAMAIGARNILVAYNVNLNTTSTRRANSIAFDVREAGRIERKGDPITGEIIKDADGNPIKIPGTLKEVKAIGWYIEEYGIAQISMNLTNVLITPVHVAFDEVCNKAHERGLRVTGSELVGLIPLQCLLDTADYFLKKQKRSLGVSEKEKIKIAVKSLGLDDLKPFNPEDKIIEYKLANTDERLVKMTLKDFAEETASESPAPGGGSVSAYLAALGVSLGTMVANLSSHKRGWDDKWEYYSDWAVKGQKIKDQLIKMVDEDTLAFNEILNAFSLPKGTEEEKVIRKNTIQNATKGAVLVPIKVMRTAFSALELLKVMATDGLPASISDAGVGALCCRSAIYGAFLNVKINISALEDQAFKDKILEEANLILKETFQKETEILDLVINKI